MVLRIADDAESIAARLRELEAERAAALVRAVNAEPEPAGLSPVEQAARDPLSVLNAVPVPTENLWPVWDSFFAGTHWSAGDVQRMLQAESVSRPGDGAVAQSGWMTFDGKNWRMDHGKAHPLNMIARHIAAAQAEAAGEV